MMMYKFSCIRKDLIEQVGMDRKLRIMVNYLSLYAIFCPLAAYTAYEQIIKNINI